MGGKGGVYSLQLSVYSRGKREGELKSAYYLFLNLFVRFIKIYNCIKTFLGFFVSQPYIISPTP